MKHCMRGRQGKHVYYSAAFTWGELQQLAVFPEDLEGLDEEQQMQRAFAKKRISEMVDYLTGEDDHFFSALTLIILPRNLERPARVMTEESAETGQWDYYFESSGATPTTRNVGMLGLSGNVLLFPADGQHRLRAGVAALRQKPDQLLQEEVPVVLVPFEGYDQVRQLFSDLNLNAKPVSKTIGYSFDTRDPIVLVAKHAARTVELFSGRVNRISNSLSKSSSNVITMNTLVEGTKNILGGLAQVEGTTREKYISKVEFDEAAREVASVWESLVLAFEDHWEPVLRNEPRAAGDLREDYIFPHGLGWQALTGAVGQLIADYPGEWPEVLQQTVDAIDWRRSNDVWQEKAMTGERVNNTGPGIVSTRSYILEVAREVAEEQGLDRAA